MGQFQPGQAKPGGSGRKRGTRNKKSENLAIALDAVGLNIPEKLAELLPQLPVEKQAELVLDLAGYLYPKRKAVEYLGQGRTSPPQVAVNLPNNEHEAAEVRSAERRERLKRAFANMLHMDVEFRKTCRETIAQIDGWEQRGTSD